MHCKKLNTIFLYNTLLLVIFFSIGIVIPMETVHAAGWEITGNDEQIELHSEGPLHSLSNIYPGYEASSVILVKNEGDLAFTLYVSANLASGSDLLFNKLHILIKDENESYEYYPKGSLSDVEAIEIGNVPAGEEREIKFTIYFPMGENAVPENEYQGQSFNMSWYFNAIWLGTDPGDEDPAPPVTPVTIDDLPFDPFTDTPAEIAAEEPVPAEIVTAVVAEVPGEQTLVTTPEETQVQPEEPQVVPLVEDIATRYWPFLLLLLLPLLIWFVAGSSVFILVPKENGKYQTVALRLAGRRDKHWFVNVEKPLAKYLESHGKIVVDFRGPMVRDAKTSIYLRNKLLSSSNMRYAVIGERRLAAWTDNLRQQVNRLVG